jgi:hypothetical protein
MNFKVFCFGMILGILGDLDAGLVVTVDDGRFFYEKP